MKHIILIFSFCLATFSIVRATTVVPYKNMAEMGLASDAVVVAQALENYEYSTGENINYRTSFEVLESLKGPLSSSQRFDLQALRTKIGKAETEISGDIKFDKGQIYLLFLTESGHSTGWQPIMLSYGIHVKRKLNGLSFWVPNEATLEINAITQDGAESLAVYKNKSLINHLTNVLQRNIKWENNKVRSDLRLEDFYSSLKAAPGHCTYLVIGGTNNRWTDFPGTKVDVYSENNGDFDFSAPSDVHGIVTNSVAELETQYQGVELQYETITDFSPNCVGGSASGGNFIGFMNSIGGTRNILVQYNDPCNQISNLVSCAGTLAIGGIYKIGTHSFDGTTWGTLGYGYVVVNNGVGACYSSGSYEIMMNHELTHSLGLGHIAFAAGDANMNPSCCEAISDLDRECLNFTYPPPTTGTPCTESEVVYDNETVPDGTKDYSNNNVTLFNTVSIANNANVFWQAENEFRINGIFTVPMNAVLEMVSDDCDE